MRPWSSAVAQRALRTALLLHSILVSRQLNKANARVIRKEFVSTTAQDSSPMPNKSKAIEQALCTSPLKAHQEHAHLALKRCTGARRAALCLHHAPGSPSWRLCTILKWAHGAQPTCPISGAWAQRTLQCMFIGMCSSNLFPLIASWPRKRSIMA